MRWSNQNGRGGRKSTLVRFGGGGGGKEGRGIGTGIRKKKLLPKISGKKKMGFGPVNPV